MNYVIINGVDSRTIQGLLIQELPPIIKPAMRTEVEEIDGRDGDIITDLGFAAYDKSLTVGLYGNFNVDEVIGFFNNSGNIIFSNEPDKVYTFSVYSQINFERLIRFRTATVTLHCQPFKFSTAEAAKTLTPEQISGQGIIALLNPTKAGETLNSFSINGRLWQAPIGTEEMEDPEGELVQLTPTPTEPITLQPITGQNNIRFGGGGLLNIASLNLGTLELAKIKNYQDKLLYTDGWVKRTAISNFTIDTNAITITRNYENVVYAKIPKPADGLCYGNTQDIACFCTHAKYYPAPNEGWDTVNAVDKIFSQADDNNFWIGFAAGTTRPTMRSILTDCKIYYVLLTRQDVPITNTGLIEQLNNILEIPLFEGRTTLMTMPANNLHAVLSVSVFADSFSVFNEGNIYSRPKLTIYGNDTVTISVNGQMLFTVDLTNDEFITIDGAAMEAYANGTLKNRLVSGSYDNFILNVGNNTVSCSGSVEKMIIENYSRWL